MSENNRIDDINLDKVTGGDNEAFEAIGEITSNVASKIGKTIFEIFEAIVNSAKTNTCPICKQQIIPGATECKIKDLSEHLKAAHSD